MTWVTDGFGTRWVEPTPRKRRRAPRALRFADLQPDTLLIHRGKTKSVRYENPERMQRRVGTARDLAKLPPLGFANDDHREVEHIHRYVGLWLCTDRWFDPCAGQDDPLKGEMAAVRPVNNYGITGTKTPHTLRGLAMQGFDHVTPDQDRIARQWIADREALMTLWRAGGITDEEARLRATPWRTLLRDLGLDGDVDGL